MNSLLIENQYLGSVNYYKMLFNYSYIEIEQYEYFQKMSFRNRCIIPGSNGLLQLSVPVEKGRNQRAKNMCLRTFGDIFTQRNNRDSAMHFYNLCREQCLINKNFDIILLNMGKQIIF